eukprot:3432659-Lingulodinium_polyedra.AAC.1
MNTASARPGRMPLVGAHASPRAPSTRKRLGARYADRTGPASQPGTPARPSAASTAGKGARPNALRQSKAAPAMYSPAASAAS